MSSKPHQPIPEWLRMALRVPDNGRPLPSAPTIRKLARHLGWRAERKGRGNQGPHQPWWLTTERGSTYVCYTTANILNPIHDALRFSWKLGRGAHLLADILENPTHPKHAHAQAWIKRQDNRGDTNGWNLVSHRSGCFQEQLPTAWTDEALAQIVVDFDQMGNLLRAVTREQARRLELIVVSAMSSHEHRSTRQRL